MARRDKRNFELQPYAVVRIVSLRSEPAEYGGWLHSQHPPRVGETGTVVEILSTPGQPDRYVVESCAADGTTRWLADFSAEELEAVDNSVT